MPENGDVQNTTTPEVITPVDTQPVIDNGAKVTDTPASTQTANTKWKDQLPDKWKKDARLDKYSSLGEAMTGLLDGSGTEKPKGAEQEQTSETETDTEYKFTKNFSEEMDSTGTLGKNLTESLKSLKLPQEQADAIYGSLVDSFSMAHNDLKTKGADMCETVLKENWGDKYDANYADMKRAYSHFVQKDSPLDKGLTATQAENNPFVVDLLAKIGAGISEHKPPQTGNLGGAQKSSGGFLSRENEKYPWR